MIDLCQWRARIGSWNCSRHWTQPSATGNNYWETNGASGNTAQVKTPRLALSIFCLLILLFISGDVELNPGPTLTDKPAQDELVELLSSSKFTAGTWEQFVCCLPNMTQDTVSSIKQEFSASQSESIDYVSAVAQHCLDSNPNITWKNIIDILLDTDELVIARILEEKLIKSNTGANKTVAKVFRDHYSRLFYATESNLRAIARELYSKGLINREVRRKPTLSKIEVEFLAMVEMYEKDKKDQGKLRQHCMVFLQCIASVKGPAKEEAFALAKDWDIELLERNKISFSIHQSLKTASNFDIIFSINSGAEDSIAAELDHLSDEFATLLTKIKEFYDANKKHEIINIARWVEERFDGVNFLALTDTKIDDIFRKLKENSYYNLLDVQSIRKILEKFPIDSKLQTRFEDYFDDVRRFILSNNVSDLKNKVKAAFEQKESAVHNSRVILKLSQKWSEQSINNLRKLMQYFFGEKADTLTYDNSFEGSIMIQFVISSENDAHLLVQGIDSQAVFMHHFGVLQLIIDGKTIIGKVEDVNFKFEQSLCDAINNFHNDIVEYQKIVLFLLQLEIDINYQSQHGWTALMAAIYNGHHRVVELLLSKDPDINIQNNDGVTALMLASCNGHHQVVELLLSKNPDINIQDMKRWTALMHASVNGHHQVVELLLSKDPDINIKTNHGWTALLYASKNGHHQVVELLLSKNPDMSIQTNNGWTALMYASKNGHHQVVELLLSKDPNICIQDNSGLTALMFASADDEAFEVLLSKLLLRKDPNNIQNNDGWSALMLASSNGHHQVVELLLSKDPKINMQTNHGWTALMLASTKGHLPVVKLLLSKNPDINIQNNDGWTALMYASANGHHQVVELLLSKDPDNENFLPQTASDGI